MEDNKIAFELPKEEAFAVKELEARLYFESLPLEVLSLSKDDFEVRTPPAVLGVRG